MAHYPGYTVLRTEDCPEQHGTLTLLTHDVSGAAVPQSCDSLPKHAERYGNSFAPDDDFVTGLFFHCRQNCIQ